jgi:hypothetical protein
MEKNMSGIQPQSLSDAELEKYIYIMLDKPVPSAWVAELLKRYTRLLDEAAAR